MARVIKEDLRRLYRRPYDPSLLPPLDKPSTFNVLLRSHFRETVLQGWCSEQQDAAIAWVTNLIVDGYYRMGNATRRVNRVDERLDDQEEDEQRRARVADELIGDPIKVRLQLPMKLGGQYLNAGATAEIMPLCFVEEAWRSVHIGESPTWTPAPSRVGARAADCALLLKSAAAPGGVSLSSICPSGPRKQRLGTLANGLIALGLLVRTGAGRSARLTLSSTDHHALLRPGKP